jgi:DNA-binding beta-propeller fold protein YncE
MYEIAGKYAAIALVVLLGSISAGANAALIYATVPTGEVWTYDTSLPTSDAIRLSKQVFTSGLNNPNGITVDAQGHVYVANTNSTEVRVYDASGTFLRSFGDTNSLLAPADVAVDASGNAYVVNGGISTSDNIIAKFDSAGNFLQFVTAPGVWSAAFYLDIARDGTLYAAANRNAAPSVAKFADDTFVESVLLSAASGVSVDDNSGEVLVAQNFPPTRDRSRSSILWTSWEFQTS